MVLGLAAGLAVVTSAIWISPPVSYQSSVTPTADPLEAAVNGARAARDAAASHLADLAAQNAALASKLPRSWPRRRGLSSSTRSTRTR